MTVRSSYGTMSVAQPSSVVRCSPIVETDLHEDKVLPPSELRPDFGHPSHLDEAKSFMELDRRHVRPIDRSDHRLLAARPCLVDESTHEPATEPRTPSILPYVDVRSTVHR